MKFADMEMSDKEIKLRALAELIKSGKSTVNRKGEIVARLPVDDEQAINIPSEGVTVTTTIKK